MSKHLQQVTQAFITERIALGEHLHDDMYRECAADVGILFPEGSTAIYHGTCHWCGNTDRALMPVAELEAMEAA